jgi:hypothetical protein
MRARAAPRGALKALRPISQAPQNTCRTAVAAMSTASGNQTQNTSRFSASC